MPENKDFLDKDGFTKYHAGIVAALEEKTNKPFIGNREPTSSDIRIEAGGSIWFDTSEDAGEETQAVNLMSLDEEELTFNNTNEDEELTFNNEEEIITEEELTFNESAEDEELTFNDE